MGRYGSIDYSRAVKTGLFLGLGLFAFGVLGQFALSAVGGDVPDVWRTLLVDAEILGVVIGLFTPIVFGIVMPLTE